MSNSIQRYSHSVLQVCATLAEDTSGSADGIHPDEIARLHEWLVYREETWHPVVLEYMREYEDAVRALVRATLNLKRPT